MKKYVSILLAFVMSITLTIPSYGIDAPRDDDNSITPPVTIGQYLDDDDNAFLEKLETIYSAFTISNGLLTISLTPDELANNYGFSSDDIRRIQELITFQHNAVQMNDNTFVGGYNNFYNNGRFSGGSAPRIYVEDWKVYFDAGEVVDYLLAAAEIGPAAMIAALSALGTAYPGVGTVIGAVIGLYGASTIIYYVFQAVSLGQGLYIGIDWNGPYPNPAIGTW